MFLKYSLTSPLSQERERSQVALFLLCVVSPVKDRGLLTTEGVMVMIVW